MMPPWLTYLVVILAFAGVSTLYFSTYSRFVDGSWAKAVTTKRPALRQASDAVCWIASTSVFGVANIWEGTDGKIAARVWAGVFAVGIGGLLAIVSCRQKSSEDT